MSGYCIVGANEEIGRELQMRGWQWAGVGCYRYEPADLSVAMQVSALLKGYPVPEGCQMLTYSDSVDLHAVTSGAGMISSSVRSSQAPVRVSSNPAEPTTSGSYVTDMPKVSRRAPEADVTMLMPILDSDGIPVASSAADSFSNMIMSGAFDEELFGTDSISDASTVPPSERADKNGNASTGTPVETQVPVMPEDANPDLMDDDEAYEFEIKKALGLC